MYLANLDSLWKAFLCSCIDVFKYAVNYAAQLSIEFAFIKAQCKPNAFGRWNHRKVKSENKWKPQTDTHTHTHRYALQYIKKIGSYFGKNNKSKEGERRERDTRKERRKQKGKKDGNDLEKKDRKKKQLKKINSNDKNNKTKQNKNRRKVERKLERKKEKVKKTDLLWTLSSMLQTAGYALCHLEWHPRTLHWEAHT